MARISIEVDVKDGQQVGQALKTGFDAVRSRVIAASQEALRRAGQEILEEGRADIASAGHFGARWLQGLTVAEDFGPEQSKITVFQVVPYWRIFQFGGIVKGKPLLWIPLSFSDAVGIKARDYGPLFRVDRRVGAPLLFSVVDKEPKYSGHESVTIPKKFHLIEIARQVASKLRVFYKEALARL